MTTEKKKALVARPGYAVGYGKPPEATRFRKGQSGNPRGRPKGSKNRVPARNEERMKAIILEEAYRGITVRDGERTVSVPIVQAVLRSLAVNAVKGQHRAQRLFAELLSAVETSNKALHDEWIETAINYKVEWERERELARRERLGIVDAPEPLPHPDHIVIDIRNSTARIAGPATKEEKAQWDEWVARRRDFEKELAEIEATHLDELLPVAAVAGKARDLPRSDSADLAQANLGHHALEAGTRNRTRPRADQSCGRSVVALYNSQRPHSTFAGSTPDEFARQLALENRAA